MKINYKRGPREGGGVPNVSGETHTLFSDVMSFRRKAAPQAFKKEKTSFAREGKLQCGKNSILKSAFHHFSRAVKGTPR